MDRELVIEHLKKSSERLHGAVAGLTAVQREFRAAEDRWSVAGCVEHVTVVEGNVLRGIQRTLERPPQPERRHEAEGKDGVILEMVPARTNRVKGPAEVMPSGRWPDFEDLMREFQQTRARTLEFASGANAGLRDHFFPHPILGPLDCWQWLLFLGTHCERHVKQIEEIKASAGFPASSGAVA